MSRLAFVDTETVTLDAGPDVMWEIGVITRDDGMPDSEWRFQLRPNMAKANPVSLEIGRFEERFELAGKRAQAMGWSPLNDQAPATMTYGALALTMHTLLDGRSVFGICPSFDTLRIGLFLRKQWGDSPTYRDPFHYQPHDVEDEVAGYLRAQQLAGNRAGIGPDSCVFEIPRPTEALAEAMGVVLKPEDKHTALGDARFARDLYDAVQNGGPF